jgi:hypothetical protein
VRLWNLKNPAAKPIVFKDHKDHVNAVAFGPQGNIVASAGKDKQIFLQPAKTQMLADSVCEKATRNLSRQEWEHFIGQKIPYQRTCKGLPIPPEKLNGR